MLFENTYPTQIKDRYALHQYLSDFREHHGIAEPDKVQGVVLGNRLLIRSTVEFEGAFANSVPSGQVSIVFDYAIIRKNLKPNSFSKQREANAFAPIVKTRTPEQVKKSILSACESGGLTDITIDLGNQRVEVIEGRKKGTLKSNPATVQVSATVNDAESFEALLNKGIGPRRDFGFGMLLLLKNEA